MTSAANVGRGAAAAILLGALALAGCGGEGGDARQGPPPDASYEVQGIVQRLPAEPDNSLYVRHEAIDDFRDAQGEVVGMDSMTMPFPVAEGVSLEGIEPGDAVAFTFEIRWHTQPRFQVTKVRELPAGTEIEFRQATPPED